MKTSKLFSVIFALLGAVLIVGTVMLSFLSLDAPVRLLGSSDAAQAQTAAFLDAICQGDYETAGSLVYGQPDLGADRASAYELGDILWETFTGSISYEFTTDCYATDSGISQDVTITALDIPALMAPLKERSQELLNERAANGDNRSEIYDENNNYQESFVMEALCDAAEELLESDAYLTTRSVTLNLTCQDGKWRILPEQELLNILSGNLAP